MGASYLSIYLSPAFVKGGVTSACMDEHIEAKFAIMQVVVEVLVLLGCDIQSSSSSPLLSSLWIGGVVPCIYLQRLTRTVTSIVGMNTRHTCKPNADTSLLQFTCLGRIDHLLRYGFGDQLTWLMTDPIWFFFSFPSTRSRKQ